MSGVLLRRKKQEDHCQFQVSLGFNKLEIQMHRPHDTQHMYNEYTQTMKRHKGDKRFLKSIHMLRVYIIHQDLNGTVSATKPAEFVQDQN